LENQRSRLDKLAAFSILSAIPVIPSKGNLAMCGRAATRKQPPQGATNRPAYRIATINKIALAAAATWFACQATIVHACQNCTAIINYDGFRFGVFWFYLLPIWTAMAIVADEQVRRASLPERPPVRFPLSGPAIRLLIVVLVTAIGGLHFLALLYFPFLVTPYCLRLKRLRKPISKHRAQHAPPWFRRAGQVTGALLAITMVPSYFLFPVLANEPQWRSKVSRVRSDMRSLRVALAEYQTHYQQFPPPLIEPQDGVFDLHLLDANLFGSSSESVTLGQRDAFRAIEWRTMPTWVADAIFFPYFLGSPYHYHYPVAREPAVWNVIQYALVGSEYVLWSRGPDGRFEPQFLDTIRSQAAGLTTATAALFNLTYDPTNGTVSSGDLYRFSGFD
jgi:hypothetical protein